MGLLLLCDAFSSFSWKCLCSEFFFPRVYNTMMSPPQTGVYQFNLRAYGNLHTNCFMFGIIKMSVQTGNVKRGDIFIPGEFIAPFKIKVIKECD